MGSYRAVILSYQDALGNAKSYVVAGNYSFSSTLPVTLSELQGTLQGLKTLLLWKTFEESNSSFFDVEYNNNAVDFLKVGQVPASGNSTSEKDYRFIHQTPTPGKNFYRLRMVDKDGVFKYSDVIDVTMEKGKLQFRVYPDPASTQINGLIVDAEDSHPHTLKIWDNTGRIVKKITVTPVPGSNIFTIPMGDLVSGMYLVQDGDNITSFVKL